MFYLFALQGWHLLSMIMWQYDSVIKVDWQKAYFWMFFSGTVSQRRHHFSKELLIFQSSVLQTMFVSFRGVVPMWFPNLDSRSLLDWWLTCWTVELETFWGDGEILLNVRSFTKNCRFFFLPGSTQQVRHLSINAILPTKVGAASPWSSAPSWTQGAGGSWQGRSLEIATLFCHPHGTPKTLPGKHRVPFLL